LIFLTFHGKARSDEHHVHVHESPWSMLGPLVALAVLSVIGGWVAAPALWGGPNYFANFLAPVFGSGEGGGAEALSEAAARNLEWTLAAVALASARRGGCICAGPASRRNWQNRWNQPTRRCSTNIGWMSCMPRWWSSRSCGFRARCSGRAWTWALSMAR